MHHHTTPSGGAILPRTVRKGVDILQQDLSPSVVLKRGFPAVVSHSFSLL